MTTPAAGNSASTELTGSRNHEPANLADILERVLDKGLVVAGDIQVNLLDIELLTIKLRLVIASLETAREVGIDWWERDPWLRGEQHATKTGIGQHLERENQQLRERLAELEGDGDRRSLGSAADREAAPDDSPAREEARHD